MFVWPDLDLNCLQTTLGDKELIKFHFQQISDLIIFLFSWKHHFQNTLKSVQND